MKRACLTILLFSCWLFQIEAQQRIALDVSYRNTKLSFSSTYHHVVKSNWLLSAGVFGGKKGTVFIDNSDDEINSDMPPQSPWAKVNQPIMSDSGRYDFLDFIVESKSFGIHFGVGYFHSFNIIHGIRGHIFSQIGYGYNQISARYYSNELQRHTGQRLEQNHFIAAITPEIYHTINLRSRFTLYYGFKLPYYFTIDKQNFNPQNKKDPFYRWGPELTLGLTVLVGKCD